MRYEMIEQGGLTIHTCCRHSFPLDAVHEQCGQPSPLRTVQPQTEEPLHQYSNLQGQEQGFLGKLQIGFMISRLYIM